MKKYFFYLSILFIFTGCDYTESKTVTTNVKTTDTGEINASHIGENTQTVVIGDQTFSSTSKLGVATDGTPEGTQSIFDIDFNTPSFQDSVSMVFDYAKTYTVDEYNALMASAMRITDDYLAYFQEQMTAAFADVNSTTP